MPRVVHRCKCPVCAQVLVDTEGRRVIYDVYGRQGLEAGLDVAVYTGGMSRDQQRAEWAEFQRRNAEQGRGGGRSGAGHTGGLGDRIASRGIYVIKVRTDSNSPERTRPNVPFGWTVRKPLSFAMHPSAVLVRRKHTRQCEGAAARVLPHDAAPCSCAAAFVRATWGR